MQFEFFYLAWLSDPLLIFGQPPFLSGTPHSELFCSFWQERESWWSAAMGSSSSPCPFASAFQRITKEKGLFFFPGVSTPFLKHDFFPTHFSFLKVWTKENWMKETIKFRPFCLSFWTIQSLIAPLVSHAVKVELGASNFIPTSAPCARTV